MSAAAIPFALSSSSTKRDEIAQGTKEQVTSCVRKHHVCESRPSASKKVQITPATSGTTSEAQNLLSTRSMIKIKRAANYRHIDRAGGGP